MNEKDDNTRIHACRQKLIDDLNAAALPLAVLELILENLLGTVRAEMGKETHEESASN